MIAVGELPAGILLFLECGCSGTRGESPAAGPVLVIVWRPCVEHAPNGGPLVRYLRKWELVSPLSRWTR